MKSKPSKWNKLISQWHRYNNTYDCDLNENDCRFIFIFIVLLIVLFCFRKPVKPSTLSLPVGIVYVRSATLAAAACTYLPTHFNHPSLSLSVSFQ